MPVKLKKQQRNRKKRKRPGVNQVWINGSSFTQIKRRKPNLDLQRWIAEYQTDHFAMHYRERQKQLDKFLFEGRMYLPRKFPTPPAHVLRLPVEKLYNWIQIVTQ